MVGDVACRRCRYNLRGLAADGRCPECGTPVGFSIQGDYLRFADPIWVGQLRSGVRLILWAVLVLALAPTMAGVLRLASTMVGADGRVSYAALPGTVAIPIVIALAGQVMFAVGAWWLTTPDPSGLGEDRYGTSRRVIRVTLAVGVGQALLSLVEQAFAAPPVVATTFKVAAGLAAVVSLVGTVAELTYISKLALRVPDGSLSRQARALRLWMGIPLGFVLVVGLAGSIFRRPLAEQLALLFSCGFGVSAIALVAAGVTYLFMLAKLSRLLGTAAAVARRTWAGAGA